MRNTVSRNFVFSSDLASKVHDNVEHGKPRCSRAPMHVRGRGFRAVKGFSRTGDQVAYTTVEAFRYTRATFYGTLRHLVKIGEICGEQLPDMTNSGIESLPLVFAKYSFSETFGIRNARSLFI